MTSEPEPCANCGAPVTAAPEGGFITGEPLTFSRPLSHLNEYLLFLCPRCFEKEMAVQEQAATHGLVGAEPLADRRVEPNINGESIAPLLKPAR